MLFGRLNFRGSGRTAVLCALLVESSPTLADPTLTVLHSFSEWPSFPKTRLHADGAGNLYGTTSGDGATQHGTVFKLAIDGTNYRLLHRFADGFGPRAGLVADRAGDLYGTTTGRGGTVFKLAPDGSGFRILHAFVDGRGGFDPAASLLADSTGKLFGTTSRGDACDEGTMFELAPDRTFRVLHSFCAEGFGPVGGLIADKGGNLYGTTSWGGAHNGGTVFELAPDGTYRVLHSFCSEPGCADGNHPVGDLIMDHTGNLYGATGYGGRSGCQNADVGSGCGTVFTLAPDGSGFRTLHWFTATGGWHPSAGLLADSAGNLYGTTAWTGVQPDPPLPFGSARLFKLSRDGSGFTVLFDFAGSGAVLPEASLIADGVGNLYGTTGGGGTWGRGTVFKLSGTGFVTEVPFAAFQASLRIIYGTAPSADSAYLRSSFTLGADSNGIDPRSEPVILAVGPTTPTIPAGSFRASAFGPITFTGTIGGVRLSASIRRIGPDRYTFDATATGANLRGTRNPVPVALAIGNDRGSTSVDAEFGSPWRRIARSR
jgi:uncharacterized repeat protein (TIGR03803 family)